MSTCIHKTNLQYWDAHVAFAKLFVNCRYKMENVTLKMEIGNGNGNGNVKCKLNNWNGKYKWKMICIIEM